jgi:hypothetical protein
MTNTARGMGSLETTARESPVALAGCTPKAGNPQNRRKRSAFGPAGAGRQIRSARPPLRSGSLARADTFPPAAPSWSRGSYAQARAPRAVANRHPTGGRLCFTELPRPGGGLSRSSLRRSFRVSGLTACTQKSVTCGRAQDHEGATACHSRAIGIQRPKTFEDPATFDIGMHSFG